MAFGGNVFEPEVPVEVVEEAEKRANADAVLEGEIDAVETRATSLETRAPLEHGRTAELEKGEEHEILAAGVTAEGAILVDTEGAASTVRVTARTAGKGFKVETTAKVRVNWTVFA